MISSAQSRAARAMLDWSQAELASRSNLSESTIRNFEAGRGIPSTNNFEAIQRALEAAGVEFTNGGQANVRLKQQRESVADLTQQIKDLSERISREEPSGRPSPERGMQQLRGAKDKNDLVKLKNRRARLERREKQ